MVIVNYLHRGFSVSLLKVLNRLRDFLNEEDSGGTNWYSLSGGSAGNSVSAPARDSSGSVISNDILSLESCAHFHRIWSAIQLVFCTPFGQNEYTVEEMFGEGLNWAGCAIILLLNQQRRFEILDFGGHLLRLQRADKKDITPEGVVSFWLLSSSGNPLIANMSDLLLHNLVV